MHLSFISGLSGSGKSVALHTLEDEGFYCIDNLPCPLLPDLIAKVVDSPDRHFEHLAIGIDARSEPSSIASFPSLITATRSSPLAWALMSILRVKIFPP